MNITFSEHYTLILGIQLVPDQPKKNAVKPRIFKEKGPLETVNSPKQGKYISFTREDLRRKDGDKVATQT